MEARIKNRFNSSKLNDAINRYDINKDNISLLNGFESYIYEYTDGSKSYILRLSHSFRRSKEMILAEVDWINYLANGSVSVSRAIPSANGDLVEVIDDGKGESFLATAFTKANGLPTGKISWSQYLFVEYGKLIGKIHRQSSKYKPSIPECHRLHWNDPKMLDIEKYLPAGDTLVLRMFHELKEYLLTLPVNPQSYGLIHQDAHQGIFIVDETGKITLFDFDDCTYSWYVNDIAIVLFYKMYDKVNESGLTEEFLKYFLRGYSSEFTLNSEWLIQIPHFLKLREIDLYAVIHRSFDVENLKDPWCAKFMSGRKEKIENGAPYLNFEFELFKNNMEGQYQNPHKSRHKLRD